MLFSKNRPVDKTNVCKNILPSINNYCDKEAEKKS